MIKTATWSLRGWIFSWNAIVLGSWKWKPAIKATWETPTYGPAGNYLPTQQATISIEWLTCFAEVTIAQPRAAGSPPVRLCCGKPHWGPVCLDGLVMCILCFRRVRQDELHVLTDGSREDVCRACAEEERKSPTK